jgi:serine phosphatase RsbU (regulator of sigma subunit)/Flp pilus assembly protein TadD
LKKRFFIFFVLFSTFLFAQKKGKEWYLLDSLNPNEFSIQDKYILDSILPMYHKATHDSIRIRCVMNLANSLGDEHLWTRYNVLGLKLAEEGGNEDVFLMYKSYALSNIGFEMANIKGDLTGALKYYEKALKVQTKLNDLTGISASLNNIADIYKKQGDANKSIEYHIKSLNVKEKNNDKIGVGITLLNLGSIYRNQGDVAAAVSCFSKALKIFEAKGEKRQQAAAINNLGHIYENEGDYEKALQNFNKAKILFEIVGEKQSCALSLTNIGQIHFKRGKSDKALTYFYEAKKIRESIDDKGGMAAAHVFISSVYSQKGNVDSALVNANRAIGILNSIQNKSALSEAYELAAGIYYDNKNFVKAEENAKKALEIGNELGYPYLIKHPALTLYKIYRNTNRVNAALDMYELHIKMRDSLSRVENKKAILRQQFKSEYDKKAAADSVYQANARMVEQNRHEHEIAKQRLFTYGGIFGFVLMLIVAFISFRAFRIKKSANKEITQQKHVIEEKQKEILDSINYAKRIQYTLLAHTEFLNTHLKEYFILFKPKDIVSGDFYWATSVRSKEFGVGSEKIKDSNVSELRTANSQLFYLAVCDSTGHGVPGAFMSLLNTSFLNEAINEKNIFEPHEVLNYVRKRLIESISREDQKDGFDGILVCFDSSNNKITYSSANTSPILISNGELLELPYDKMPVGQGERTNSFTLHTLNYKKGDTLYLGTDGYVDQFGGTDGKKFKYRRLCETLKQNAALNLSAQKNVLEITFTDWKGNLDQVDDVLLIGVKL